MAINWMNRGCDTKKGWWITAEDKKIKIRKMTAEHIQNCIRYIQVYGGVLQDSEFDKIQELEDELTRRDDKHG